MSFVAGLDGVKKNLALLYTGERAGMKNAMGEIASLLGAYAKAHHPWTPRTGATDASTRGAITKADDTEIVVALTAGMDYDEFLELAREGRYSWLWPAVIANQERILQILLKYGVEGMASIHASEAVGT